MTGQALQKREGSALSAMAARLEVDPTELKDTLVNTVFKKATDTQMTALCIVANEYGLNPFVKELYAFPSANGIVPMVSIDGWLRIINSHPQMAGMDIVYAENSVTEGKSRLCPEYIEVTIHRKDRPHTSSPIREYLDECYRNTEPWNHMTRRMLRHKAIMQAGRVVFSLSGIYDVDEANDILAKEGKRIVQVGGEYEVIDGTATEDTEERLDSEAWSALVASANEHGFTEDDVLANAAALGYEGPGDGMPRDVATKLYGGMKKAAQERDKKAARQAKRDQQAETAPAGPATVTPLRPESASAELIAEIDEKRKELPDMYDAEFASLIDQFGDYAAPAYGLTEETAGYVLEALDESGQQ